jgi:hypothetical protein
MLNPNQKPIHETFCPKVTDLLPLKNFGTKTPLTTLSGDPRLSQLEDEKK